MSIEQVTLLGQSSEIDILRGWLIIGLACLILVCALCYWLGLRLEREQKREQLRREYACRYNLRHRD